MRVLFKVPRVYDSQEQWSGHGRARPKASVLAPDGANSTDGSSYLLMWIQIIP